MLSKPTKWPPFLIKGFRATYLQLRRPSSRQSTVFDLVRRPGCWLPGWGKRRQQRGRQRRIKVGSLCCLACLRNLEDVQQRDTILSLNDVKPVLMFIFVRHSGSYPKSRQQCRTGSCRGRRETSPAEGGREAARVAGTEPPSPKSVSQSFSQSIKSVCKRRPASPSL